jgi:hypothetical protein
VSLFLLLHSYLSAVYLHICALYTAVKKLYTCVSLCLLLHSYISTVYLHICALLACLRLFFIYFLFIFYFFSTPPTHLCVLLYSPARAFLLLIYLIEFLFFSPPPTYLCGAYDYSPARALLGAFFIFIFIFDFFGTPTYLCGVYDYSPARALLVARIQPHFSTALFLFINFIYCIFSYSYKSGGLLACSRSARRSHSAALLSRARSARSLSNASANCCEFASVHFCTINTSTFVLVKQVN